MHTTIIHPLTSPSRPRRTRVSQPATVDHRKPHYEVSEHPDRLDLTVYVPGVDSAGVEVSFDGTDLLLTARKARFVRVNWQALHLEKAQRDYQLVLRLGSGVDFDRVEATLQAGVLTIKLPKKLRSTEPAAARALQYVA
jgi:HSP20 family molecular chaperone IbpA